MMVGRTMEEDERVQAIQELCNSVEEDSNVWLPAFRLKRGSGKQRRSIWKSLKQLMKS